MIDNKRDTIRYIAAASYTDLIKDFKSAPNWRKRELINISIALYKKFGKVKRYNNVYKFLKYATGIKERSSSDNSENAEMP